MKQPKTAMPQKATETALSPRLISADLLRGWMGGRSFAKGKRRFAKGFCLPSAAQLALYSIRLRFKHSKMPERPSAFIAHLSSFIFRSTPPNKPNRSGCLI